MTILQYIQNSKYFSPKKNVILYDGPAKVGILIVGEQPKKSDEIAGYVMSTGEGKLLRDWMEDLEKDSVTGFCNAIPIMMDSKIESEDILYFKPVLQSIIIKTQPKLVIMVGDIACRMTLNLSYNHLKNGAGRYLNSILYLPFEDILHYSSLPIEGFKKFSNLIEYGEKFLGYKF